MEYDFFYKQVDKIVGIEFNLMYFYKFDRFVMW